MDNETINNYARIKAGIIEKIIMDDKEISDAITKVNELGYEISARITMLCEEEFEGVTKQEYSGIALQPRYIDINNCLSKDSLYHSCKRLISKIFLAKMLEKPVKEIKDLINIGDE